MNRLLSAATCAAILIAPIAFSTNKASAGEVLNREQNQQQRIEQGVKKGTINQSELQKLEHRESRIDAARQRALEKNDGHLTPQQVHNLNQRENALSNAIYRAKHN